MVLEALDASNRPRGLSRQRSCAPRISPGAAGRDRVTSSAEPWNTRVRGPDPESAFPREEAMHRTKNDLPEKVRTQVVGLLQERLADCIDLVMQAKQAHWNVKGPSFIALHELFDKVYEHAQDYADLIAERIVQFGGIAEGTVRVAAKRSRLQEYPLTIANGKEHVEALSHALAYFGGAARTSID